MDKHKLWLSNEPCGICKVSQKLKINQRLLKYLIISTKSSYQHVWTQQKYIQFCEEVGTLLWMLFKKCWLPQQTFIVCFWNCRSLNSGIIMCIFKVRFELRFLKFLSRYKNLKTSIKQNIWILEGISQISSDSLFC